MLAPRSHITILFTFLFVQAIGQPKLSKAQPTDEAKQLYEEGVKLSKKKDFEGAVKKFDSAIEANNEFGKAYLQRAKAKRVLGIDACSEDVMNDYSKAMELEVKGIEAYAGRAEGFVCMKEFDKAWVDIEVMFEKVQKKRYAHPYTVRAFYYISIGKSVKALNDLNMSLRNDSLKEYRISNLELRAHAFISIGKFDAAQKDLDELLSKAPKNSDYQYLYGESYMGLKKYKEAKESFEAAINIDNGAALYFIGRGKANLKLNALEAADSDFKSAGELIEANGLILEDVPELSFYQALTAWKSGNESVMKESLNEMWNFWPYTDKEVFNAYYNQHKPDFSRCDYLYLMARLKEENSKILVSAALDYGREENSMFNRDELYMFKAEICLANNETRSACSCYRNASILGNKEAKKEIKKLKCN